MRKLLLGTTALAAAATLSANAVLASPSISGAMEWTYESRDPGTAGTSTGASNDDFSSDTNIKLSFENKTDSGLTIGLVYDMESVGDDNANANDADENYMYIKGGFGTITLGQNDGAGDQLTRTAHDLVGPDAASDNGGGFTGATSANSLADDNADLVNDIGDENNITYMLPSMGGLSIGVSYKDAGDTTAANADETAVGVKYAFESGAVKGSIHYGNNSISGATAGAGSKNSDTMAIDLASGPFRAVVAKATSDVTTAIQTEITDYGVQYNLGNGITLAAVGTQIDENTGGETSDITTVSVKYNVASGLDAYLTYHDYDYEDGTTGTTADDDGSVTFLTIKATF
jgi:outer membrane protein OmpU